MYRVAIKRLKADQQELLLANLTAERNSTEQVDKKEWMMQLQLPLNRGLQESYTCDSTTMIGDWLDMGVHRGGVKIKCMGEAVSSERIHISFEMIGEKEENQIRRIFDARPTTLLEFIVLVVHQRTRESQNLRHMRWNGISYVFGFWTTSAVFSQDSKKSQLGALTTPNSAEGFYNARNSIEDDVMTCDPTGIACGGIVARCLVQNGSEPLMCFLLSLQAIYLGIAAHCDFHRRGLLTLGRGPTVHRLTEGLAPR
jgi:hypothetical protein